MLDQSGAYNCVRMVQDSPFHRDAIGVSGPTPGNRRYGPGFRLGSARNCSIELRKAAQSSSETRQTSPSCARVADALPKMPGSVTISRRWPREPSALNPRNCRSSTASEARRGETCDEPHAVHTLHKQRSAAVFRKISGTRLRIGVHLGSNCCRSRRVSARGRAWSVLVYKYTGRIAARIHCYDIEIERFVDTPCISRLEIIVHETIPVRLTRQRIAVGVAVCITNVGVSGDAGHVEAH